MLGIIGVGEREGRMHKPILRGKMTESTVRAERRLRAVKRDRRCCVREDEGTVLGGKNMKKYKYKRNLNSKGI